MQATAWQGKPLQPHKDKIKRVKVIMAIAHIRIKTLTRSRGQSAVAKAAYNSCACLSFASGDTIDYTKKTGLELAEIITSDKKKRQIGVNFGEDRNQKKNAKTVN